VLSCAKDLGPCSGYFAELREVAASHCLAACQAFLADTVFLSDGGRAIVDGGHAPVDAQAGADGPARDAVADAALTDGGKE